MSGFNIQRWQVKYLVAAVGTIGLYAGGFLGAYLVASSEMGWLLAFLTLAGCALLGSFGAMTAVDAALGAAASHVDILKVLACIGAAAAGLWLLDLACQKLLGLVLAPFFVNLALFGAGWAAIRADERT